MSTTVKYKGSTLATVNNQTKTLLTSGKWLEDDIELTDVTSGSGEEPTDAVRFFDYDGTVLYQYTASAFLALSAMPTNPSHTGLVAQGWNWSLADAQDYVEDWGFLDIGQMYTTSNGKTEIDIEIPDVANLRSLYLSVVVNGTALIEWGDNSTTTVTGTSITSVQVKDHTYTASGSYTICISASSGDYGIRATTGRPCISGPYTAINNNYVYAAMVKAVRVGANAYITNYAFKDCCNLESITLPNTLKSTGASSWFTNCYHLRCVTIPSISTLTQIYGSVFDYCYAMEYLSIPVTMRYITGSQATYGLRGLYYPKNSAAQGNLFYGISGIPRYIVPSLNKKVIRTPKTVVVSTNAGYMFQNEADIAGINASANINTFAFYGCPGLRTLTVESGVTTIANSAAGSSYALKSVSLPSGLTATGGNTFMNCYSLQSVSIPDTATLGDGVFMYCNSLQNVRFPAGITVLPSSTFAYCYTLPNITLPSTLTEIKGSSFGTCRTMSKLTIPASVTTIGNAFSNCYGMQEYHFLATTPPALTANAFSGINANCKIYVPSASLSAYQTATNWSAYASYMVGE